MVSSQNQPQKRTVIKQLLDLARNGDKKAQADVEKLLQLREPLVKEIHQVDVNKNMGHWIRLALNGDLNATQEIIYAVKWGTLPIDDEETAITLKRIFLSKSATPRQKELIWTLKDQVIYAYMHTYEVEREEQKTELEWYYDKDDKEYHDTWVTKTYKFTETQQEYVSLTFSQYILNHIEQIKHLLRGQ